MTLIPIIPRQRHSSSASAQVLHTRHAQRYRTVFRKLPVLRWGRDGTWWKFTCGMNVSASSGDSSTSTTFVQDVKPRQVAEHPAAFARVHGIAVDVDGLAGHSCAQPRVGLPRLDAARGISARCGMQRVRTLVVRIVYHDLLREIYKVGIDTVVVALDVSRARRTAIAFVSNDLKIRVGGNRLPEQQQERKRQEALRHRHLQEFCFMIASEIYEQSRRTF